MPFCVQCGMEVNPADRFCSKCGAPANRTPQDSTATGGPTPAETPQETAGAQNGGPEPKYVGVGLRFLAQIFDAIPILIFWFIVGNRIAAATGGLKADGFDLKGIPALVLMLLTLAFIILYFTVLETWWHGQSLGKKILGIRVLTENGGQVSPGQSFLRNALRLVDGFMAYLVAAIFIWRSGKKQRLGDRLAGTVVVRKNTAFPR